MKQAKFTGAKVVVSRGAKTLAASEEDAPSGKPMPAALDQHAWLDPKNGIVYVKNIAEALAKQDPADAASYHARAAAYTDAILVAVALPVVPATIIRIVPAVVIVIGGALINRGWWRWRGFRRVRAA